MKVICSVLLVLTNFLGVVKGTACEDEYALVQDSFMESFGGMLSKDNPYASMTYYSGKDFNELGNFQGCRDLDIAQYVLIDFSSVTRHKTQIGLCLPAVCSKDDIEDLIFEQMEGNSRRRRLIPYNLSTIERNLQYDDSLGFSIIFAEKEVKELQESMSAGAIIMLVICMILVIT